MPSLSIQVKSSQAMLSLYPSQLSYYRLSSVAVLSKLATLNLSRVASQDACVRWIQLALHIHTLMRSDVELADSPHSHGHDDHHHHHHHHFMDAYTTITTTMNHQSMCQPVCFQYLDSSTLFEGCPFTKHLRVESLYVEDDHLLVLQATLASTHATSSHTMHIHVYDHIDTNILSHTHTSLKGNNFNHNHLTRLFVNLPRLLHAYDQQLLNVVYNSFEWSSQRTNISNKKSFAGRLGGGRGMLRVPRNTLAMPIVPPSLVSAR